MSVPATTVLDAKTFEGRVKETQLSRNSFFDSLIIAITTLIIGLPAVNWIYIYVPLTINKVPTIQCLPPTLTKINESASRADIEYFCLYHHTLYASFFPVVVMFFGFFIAVLHFVWRNYNSGKFDLFFSLVNEMTRTKNEKSGKYEGKNDIIIQQLTKTFSEGNHIYYSYLGVKALQAASALVTILVIVIYVSSIDHSTLLSTFSNAYDVPTFYCQIDQFELSSSYLSSNVQVPCFDITSRTTFLILFVDFVLLLVVFVFSIVSMFQQHPKELQHHQAARFSFHTGLSPHYYDSGFELKRISSDLDFLLVVLLRTDFGLAQVFWEKRTLHEIDLLNNDDLMRSNLNYEQQKLARVYKINGGLYI